MRQGTQRVFSDSSRALRLDAEKATQKIPIQDAFEDV
jgi:hypothetical protein